MYPLKIKVNNNESWNHYQFYYEKEMYFSPKEITIYCNQSPKKLTSVKEKVCSILFVDGDIVIYPHKNDNYPRMDIYYVVKDNLSQFIDGEVSF